VVILGLNAYHADAAAAILVDGQLVAAAEEERFLRIKHWAGLPIEAVKYCLREAKVEVQSVDHIAVNRDPNANLLKKALFVFSKRPGLTAIRDRLQNAARVHDVRQELETGLDLSPGAIRAQIHHVEHHRAHLASSFLVSPFESAAVASVDGFGDFVSTMVGRGTGNKIAILDRVTFPHSLGLFYLALTQYLGFPDYGDEYKVMGLAAYGKPEYLEALRRVVRLKSKGRFELHLRYFVHHSEGVAMTWERGAPLIGRVYSDDLVRLLGPPRGKDEPVEGRHENLAASLQAMYEEAFFHMMNDLYGRTREKALCLAGGCALNSVANGQITVRSPFERVYIPPAAGDAGGAVGAAFSVWHEKLGSPRSFVMDRADWGPEFSEAEVEAELQKQGSALARAGCRIERCADEAQLCRRTAEDLAAGRVVGWFLGRMEWGSRALGHRSILADPRRPEMKDVLNARIKRREPFRPFAPSIVEGAVGEYFERTQPSPFMTMTYPVKPTKREIIPAPTHVDGSGRLQTVAPSAQPRYWRLLKEFECLTGVPLALNTSFNENEPIVCTPEQALSCFLRTRMDVLALGPFVIRKGSSDVQPA
jgi:carbamoyltransferase